MSKQPLRVVQILPELHVGGVERGTIDWALQLKLAGHTSMVISGGGHGADYLSRCDIHHITLPVGKKSLRSLFLIKKLRLLFEELEVDVVHARSRLPAWLSYWAIKKMKNKPVFVTTLHGLHTVSPYASIMAKGDAVIAVSNTAKHYLKTHFANHLKSAPVVIYRGIDANEFPYGFAAYAEWLSEKKQVFPNTFQNKKVFLPGRLSEIKGAMGLIPWLSQADQNTSLMVNAKPDESQFSRQFSTALKKQGIEDRVMWLGVERDMKQLYAWADLVLSVNKKPESFGRTVLEALTIGCPVIGFDHGGVSEVMGQLFPEGLVETGDWQAMGNRISQFLQNKPTVQKHNSFTNEKQFDQTLAVYHSVLSNRESQVGDL